MTVAHAKAPKGAAEESKPFVLYIIAVAALLRFYRLANQSFGFDEGTTLDLTNSVDLIENARQLYSLNGGGERFQPLYNLILPYWRYAFGDNEFAIRSFSTLASIGAVTLIALTAYYLFGRTHAIWTGILAASSSFAVYYSQEARALRPVAVLLISAGLLSHTNSDFMGSGEILALVAACPYHRCRNWCVLQPLFLPVLNCTCDIAPDRLSGTKAMAPLVVPRSDRRSACDCVLHRRRPRC